MKTVRIMYCAGGTAGSVSPLLAVAEELRQQGQHHQLFVGTSRGPEGAMIHQAEFPFMSIPSGKLRRYRAWSNLLMPFVVLWSFIVCWRLIRRWQPMVIVSAGSFVAVPMVWAGWFLRRRIIIHQQDVLPGLANRLTAPCAHIITVAQPELVNHFGSRATFIGNPVRPSLRHLDPLTAKEQLEIHDSRPIIAVLGGGTGATFLNRLIVEHLDELTSEWHILHGTGGRPPLAGPRPGYIAQPFFSDMELIYAAADVIITRAGWGTFSEVAATRKVSIVIPMPDTHQVANGRYIAERHLAHVIWQSELTFPLLRKAIERLLHDSGARAELERSLVEWDQPDATASMARHILSVV